VPWPASLDFVQINEDSKLSKALHDKFLPFRAAVLKDHLCRDLQVPKEEIVSLQDMIAAPAQLSVETGTNILSQRLDATGIPAEKSILQEALNEQQLAQRRVERSLPGSLWPSRRTH
jgi:hypothetical protein